jgi:mannosyltransferase
MPRGLTPLKHRAPASTIKATTDDRPQTPGHRPSIVRRPSSVVYRLLPAACPLLLSAYGLRLYGLTAQSLWRDEVDALRFAQLPLSDYLSIFSQPGQNGPLYFLLLRGWVALAGTGEFSLRYFSLLPGVVAVALTLTLGRRLFTAPIGLIAAALVAASPYLVWYSQEAKMYALITALALLSLYALRQATAGQPRWWVVVVTATSLAMYSHILAALLIPLQLALLTVWRPVGRRGYAQAAAAFAALILPYVPLLRWQLPMALTPAETGYPFFPLPEMLLILLNGYSAGLVPWVSEAVLALFGLLLLSGATARFSPSSAVRHRSSDAAALLLWLFLPVVVVFAISLVRPLFTDRYLIWIAPAFYLLVALGIAAWAQRVRWLGPALLGLLLVLDLQATYIQVTTPFKSDFRSAAAYVAARIQPGDLVIFQIPYVRYTFDYYYRGPAYTGADGLWTNAGLSEAEADTAMRGLTQSYRAVWLVESESTMWDQRGLVRRWLDAHGQVTEGAEFTRVNVIRYLLLRSP